MRAVMPALSLKTKMSLGVSLFVTAVISLLALSTLWYFEGEFKKTISRHQFAMISAMAEDIDTKLLNAQMQLIAVAGQADSGLAGTPLKAQHFLENHAGIRTVFDSGIFIFSPDGTLVAAAPTEPLLQGRNYSFRAYIKDTIATGKPQISMPFVSTQKHHHPIVMFTAPFFDASGKMTGILTGALDLMRDNFLGKLATVRLGDKGYLFLYSTDRTMIVHPDRTRILKRDVPPGVNRLFDRAIEGFEGTDETVNSRGLHALSSFKRLKSTNWILAANFPQVEAYAPVNRAKGYLLAAAVIALILSNIIVWWFMHRLTAPLLLFTRHVKGIVVGKEYEPKPILIVSGDEIGTLAQAFNEMLSELAGRKKTIRLQKEFSDNLLLNSAVPTFVLDNRHRVIIWNRACEELTGIEATVVLGTTDHWKAFYRKERPLLADIVIDGNIDDLADYYDSHNKSPFTSDGLQAEGWCLTSNNRDRYIFFDAAPVRNGEGEIIAVVETVQDITERKRASEELEFKNAILSTQQETSIDGILMVDESGTIISFNRRFYDLWQIPPELVEAGDDEPVLQLVATRVADREAFLTRVRHIYEHREEKCRDELLLRDGRVFERYSAPLRRSDGKYFGRVWYFRDITERKRMEEAIRESEERYRAVVELSPDAIYVHSGGIMTFANSEGAKLLGVDDPEDIYGREALDFVHPDSRDLVRQRIAKAFRTGDPNPPIEEIFLKVDGTHVPVEVASVPYKYQGDDALLIIARDITERRRLQDELLKAQKLESLGVLAGGIAHDFNNILTGILGNLSIAKLQTDPSQKIVERLVLCEKAAIQATELTRQLLTFARGGEPVKRLINPASLINETVSFALRGSNIRCIIDIQDDIWCLEADESQLGQVLNNLLINAAQSMPAGGEIRVSAVNETLLNFEPLRLLPGDFICISVEDRGCGIPEESLVRIFDPYFTTKPNGSGLGLASVYSIVKRHGGAVEVFSSQSVGTCFKIHLPAVPGSKPEEEGVSAPAELKGNGRILIMDDEELIRDIAAYTLEFMGYEVESCDDGREAVEHYREAYTGNDPFSAVILDLTIPGRMGGKEAAALILEIDPDAVLIVSSGYCEDPVIADYRKYGFSGVVPKPFDAESLAMELKKVLSGTFLKT